MNKRITTEEFIKRAKETHGNKYDYSESVYTIGSEKIKIICPSHGDFFQKPSKHIKGSICRKCYHDELRLSKNKFIDRCVKKYKNKYDYSNVEYINNCTDIKIICSEHGAFFTKPNIFLSGSVGCPKCAIKKHFYTTEDFINKSNLKHNNKYTYDKTIYKHSTIPVIITCIKHGDFNQKPKSHLEGHGCPSCRSSKGESKIKHWLDIKFLKYTVEYRFKNCRDKYTLPFDFYLHEHNICIEFDGIQHFKVTQLDKDSTLEKSKLKFINTLRRDKIKTDFCKNNNIKLIRIPYTEFNNIEQILEKEIPLKTE